MANIFFWQLPNPVDRNPRSLTLMPFSPAATRAPNTANLESESISLLPQSTFRDFHLSPPPRPSDELISLTSGKPLCLLNLLHISSPASSAHPPDNSAAVITTLLLTENDDPSILSSSFIHSYTPPSSRFQQTFEYLSMRIRSIKKLYLLEKYVPQEGKGSDGKVRIDKRK